LSEQRSKFGAVLAVTAARSGVASPPMAAQVPSAAAPLGLWRRWVERPRHIWLRRALFQVHLWVGIAIGLYILMISLTGSAIVYRREISRKYSRPPVVLTPAGQPKSADELKQIAMRLYPDYRIVQYFDARKPSDPVAIVLRRNGKGFQRLFNPYTGEDLGDPLSPQMRAIEWLADLHDNLLAGKTGRMWNGIGSIFTVLLAVTGLVVWWPGIKGWRRALTVSWRSRLARINYDLHSMLGFWFSMFVLMWGVTGIYLSFPAPFYAVLNRLDPNDNYTDTFLQQFEFVHFGRYGPFWEGIWVALGLVPAILFVTGLLMWWNRKLRHGARWPD
jgi:uncharacterized iron-regulated membrane protein